MNTHTSTASAHRHLPMISDEHIPARLSKSCRLQDQLLLIHVHPVLTFNL